MLQLIVDFVDFNFTPNTALLHAQILVIRVIFMQYCYQFYYPKKQHPNKDLTLASCSNFLLGTCLVQETILGCSLMHNLSPLISLRWSSVACMVNLFCLKLRKGVVNTHKHLPYMLYHRKIDRKAFSKMLPCFESLTLENLPKTQLDF